MLGALGPGFAPLTFAVSLDASLAGSRAPSLADLAAGFFAGAGAAGAASGGGAASSLWPKRLSMKAPTWA